MVLTTFDVNFKIEKTDNSVIKNIQGYNMCKVEQLSHEHNSILGMWKVSDFSKSYHQLHIFNAFQLCVINTVLFAISHVGNIAAQNLPRTNVH